MRIKEITFRSRNDFHYIAECKHCGKDSEHSDGYADRLYCLEIVPARFCEHCGVNEYGKSQDDPDGASVSGEAPILSVGIHPDP